MKSKNKSILSIEQINENLKKEFPGKPIVCTEINENEIYIESDIMNIVITEKKLFKMATTVSMMDYKIFCRTNRIGIVEKQIKYSVYIPFIPLRRLASITLKEQEQKVLFACGMKKEKQETVIDRLRTLGCKTYVDIYKMIQELEITHAYFEDYKYGIERLVIEHTKGRCAFEVSAIGETCEGELKDIFLGVIKVPVDKEIKHIPESIELYSKSKMVS